MYSLITSLSRSQNIIKWPLALHKSSLITNCIKHNKAACFHQTRFNQTDSNAKNQQNHDEKKENSGDQSKNQSQTSEAEVMQRDNEDYVNIPEEELVLASLQPSRLLPEVPLMSLNIEKRLVKVEKKGSFTADIFTGKYDDEFLVYPDALDNRIENQQLKDQAAMVRQLWPQIWNENLQLQKFNFFNLYQLSVTEMMTIFEAIGASSRSCTENTSFLANKNENDNQSNANEQSLVTKAVISLITRNCLTYWPIHKSENDKIKSVLPKKHIIFGGASVEASREPYLPIGFCWSEDAPTLGSLPPQEWSTLGEHGGKSVDHYLIKGKKTNVLFEESTENYLVYFRDKFLSERVFKEFPEEDANPASDPFVGCCLLHKSELNFGSAYQDSAGFKYRNVDIDTIVSSDRLVFPAGRKDPTAVNIKALGQLATCAVSMGYLKDTLRRLYVYLIEKKRGLLSCDIIERKLAGITGKIFGLESMVYFIAGMYDGLKGFDAHMEATILKIVTNDFAYEILRDLQQILGSDMFILSKLQDQLNIYDSFLDGAVYNRLYLSTMGILWFARNKNMHLNQMRLAPWYPGYFLKNMIKETSERGDFMMLKADIYGNLHPSLKEAATNLEYIVKRVKYASDQICMDHGSDVTGAQTSLYKLSQLAIDSFLLTAMCSRASKSYCNGSRNCELDLAMTTTFSFELAGKVKSYIEELQTVPFSALNNRSRTINEENIRYGGYYAESPLDPNI